MTQINLEDALEAVDVAMLGVYRPTFERVVKALRASPQSRPPMYHPYRRQRNRIAAICFTGHMTIKEK